METTPFEAAKQVHASFMDQQPIVRDDALQSLEMLEKIGAQQIAADELGRVNYANQMTAVYGKVLAQHEAEVVQPPLTTEQVAEITTKLGQLSIFTEGNGEAGNGNTATDTSNLKTAGRKQ